MPSIRTRYASALFVTILTVGLVSFLLLRAATTVKARIDSHQLLQAKQQAIYAAEAVAALMEVELVEIAATNDLDQLATKATDGAFWRGNEKWFANCRVRWRVEPVAVTNGSEFTVNPAPDPSITPPPPTDLDGQGGTEAYATNYDFYNFRITTEAYYLTDPDDAFATPWSDTSDRVAIAQSMRVVQLRLNTLFKYALFYAAVGPEGDIEFHNGKPLNVMGSVHSNGAIYFGGDQNQNSYDDTIGRNLHPGDNSDVIIGQNATDKRVSVVGIDGLYRSQKYPLYWAFRWGNLSTMDPRHLPLAGTSSSVFNAGITSSVPMTGDDNSNAGTSNRYQINGVPLQHGVNDSRTPAGMEAAWSALVRDGVTRGATIVRTLSNIPELGGRPFEPSRSVVVNPAQEVPLWVRDPTNGDFTLTVLPNNPPGTYYYDPFGDRSPLLDADGNQVFADSDDDDYAFVSSPPDAAFLLSTSRLPQHYQVRGIHPDSLSLSDPDYATKILEANGRAKRLYYRIDPTTIAASDKNDRTSSTNYDIAGSGYVEPGTSTIPGLPDYIQTTPSAWPVFAGGMPSYFQQDKDGTPLFLANGGSTLVDVTDPVANAFDDLAGRSWHLADGDPDHFNKGLYSSTSDISTRLTDRDGTGNEHDGFRANEALGVYYKFALFEGSNNDPGPGLAIRERPSQATWFMDPTGADPAPPAGYALPEIGDYAGDTSRYLKDLSNYLKSQYIVYFGFYMSGSTLVHRDVTVPFFEHGLATALSDQDLIATEEWVRNRRETGFMGWRFNLSSSVALNDFKVNWLTLNMAQVCNFLDTTVMSTVQLGGSATETLKENFNGMVYVSRTRRSETHAPSDSDTAMFLGDYPKDGSGTLLPHGFHPIWNPDWRRPLDPRRLDFTWNASDYIPPSHMFTDRALQAAVRCGNGPDCTFQSAVRLRNGAHIDWGGRYTPAGGSFPTRTRGLTVVSPNAVFLWGDYNTTMTNASGATSDYKALASSTAGSPSWAVDASKVVSDVEYENNRPAGYNLPPCAIFTDSLNVLSNAWTDGAQAWSGDPTDAADTWYQTSVVTNNVPTYLIDSGTNVMPSGGPHNLIRFLEDWVGSTTFHIKGSVVVMGVAKHSLAEAGWNGNSSRTMNVRYYQPPVRDIQFNTDLFTRAGQPPFTPFGVTVIRTVQTVNIKDQ